MAIEQPSYRVELNAKPFQIRDYDPYVVAQVQVGGARDAAVNEGFRILASYIFGANHSKAKIAMTAPVTQSGEKIAQKIEMTAPVSQAQSDGGWTVHFGMPVKYTIETLPTPDDTRVHFAQVPAHRAAVITFSGFWSDANFQKHRAQLMDFVVKHGLKPLSPPVFAYYDPPWMPWFWRTNEVQVELAK